MQLVLEKRAERSNTIALVSPLIAIGLTIVTMSILFAILGKNPILALGVYFIDPLTDSYSLQEIAVKATPLVMIGIGLSLCYLANVWNIGAEGQFLIGAVAGSWLAVKTQGTGAGYWVLPAMLVLSAAAGALYALIPAICKVRFGASEILTSLMLVYVADLFLDYMVRGPWRDPAGCISAPSSPSSSSPPRPSCSDAPSKVLKFASSAPHRVRPVSADSIPTN
jgi:simple sugar transport system permease protein